MKKNQICAFLDMAAISPKRKKWKNWLLEDVDRKTKGYIVAQRVRLFPDEFEQGSFIPR